MDSNSFKVRGGEAGSLLNLTMNGAQLRAKNPIFISNSFPIGNYYMGSVEFLPRLVTFCSPFE